MPGTGALVVEGQPKGQSRATATKKRCRKIAGKAAVRSQRAHCCRNTLGNTRCSQSRVFHPVVVLKDLYAGASSPGSEQGTLVLAVVFLT